MLLAKMDVQKYDYLIVGAGLFGAVVAWRAKQAGRSVLVIDKRSHRGGNIYCESVDGINVHKYGAHIFHTSNREVWEFVNRFADFNNYINSPVANYKGRFPPSSQDEALSRYSASGEVPR